MSETVLTEPYLPQIIRAIRGELTQKEFATALGVSEAAVSQWESGKIGLSLDSAVALLKFANGNGKGNLAVLLLRAVGASEMMA